MSDVPENKPENTEKSVDETAASVAPADDAQPDTGEQIGEQTAEQVTASAETEGESESVAEETPTLASGLDIGGEGAETSEEGDEEAPYFEPKIRGKIDKFGVAWGTGRRKTSVARVRVKEGNGDFTVNGRPLDDYFRIERDRGFIEAPLKAVEALGKVDVTVTVAGGGITGQTGAVVLGIARALQARDPQHHHTLSEGGFLTRDSRMVERKKYGKKGARRSFQFSKR